ncbi:MAG TPA: M3 family metallopeptidase [bacterium]|nr:M3 family metallopeptidase [bacterium]
MKKFLMFIVAVVIVVSAVFVVVSGADAEIKDQKYLEMKEQTEALYLVQGLLSWFVRTQGERSVFEESYKGHEDLFSKDSVEYLTQLMKNPGLTDDDRKKVRYLRNAFLLEYVAIETAGYGDMINDAESETTVELDWVDSPVPYRQLLSMMANEEDPEKRQKLQSAQAGVWKEVLNPIYAEEEEHVKRLSKELGYKSYVALAEEFREVDLKAFIKTTDKFKKETDEMYRVLFEQEVKEVMGITPEEFTRADIQYFASVPAFKTFFPAELTIPAFMYFLEGMGLDLETKAGTKIKIDDEIREKKHPRAACYSMTVPDDIRITVKPSGGKPDFETFFHEGGHAMHYANTEEKDWEYQSLGNNAVTEGFAIFFENIWGDYEWLLKYRELVEEYNRFQPVDKRVPVMTDSDMGKIIRNNVFWKVYMVRRYNWAKLLYESILHGGEKEYYADFYKGDYDDPHRVYKELFSEAYGFKLTDTEALRFRTDVDSFFYAADYARAFLLSEQLDMYMRNNYGKKWFDDTRAGDDLSKKLWALGNKPHANEVAVLAGFDSVSYDVFKKRIEEQLELADRLINGK